MPFGLIKASLSLSRAMPDTVTITVLLNLKPEATAIFCAALPEMLKDTRNFPGFRSIRVLKNKADANQLIFIEEWDSEEDYGAYIAWRTERGDMDSSAGAHATPPRIDVWPTVVTS
jgi:heme-degrading monooxygenase HmoA